MKLNLLLILIFLNFNITAQSKREFRGAWIATIGGIDWPSAAARKDVYLQQQEFKTIVDKLDSCGINALIVQVRPAADAFYESSYEPWSKYLTGIQGAAPEPYYDAMKFMIDIAHEHGMEFHAWLNPYRALVDANKNPNPSNHITHQHPEWFINYGGKKYFDPGIPEVQTYVNNIVAEIVKKYDVDAIHFDDYFYPYRIAHVEFGDAKTFYKYGSAYASKDDWRRDNVNTFIKNVQATIKKIKPTVKLGISPFGVWRNIAKDADGSNTNGGQTNYDDLYADVILWQKNGWIDYLLPQLYWEQGHRAVDFNTLLDWWANHAYNRGLFIGYGLYQLGVNKAAAWHTPQEIVQQVTNTRANIKVQGGCYYSTNYFFKNKYGIADIIKNDINKTKAIVPVMPWLDATMPNMPDVVNVIVDANNTLKFTVVHKSADAKYCAIYKFLLNEKIDIALASKLVYVTSKTNIEIQNMDKRYKYVITSLDKLHNESLPVTVPEKK
jgi:uncharacterized lipoprotein YddW (UPF0748 family)